SSQVVESYRFEVITRFLRCGAVHTSRPEEFPLAMQYPRHIQQESLEAKLAGKPFVKVISRQLQQHWWKTFLLRSRESGNWNCPQTFFKQSLAAGRLPVTKRRIYRESWSQAVVPYLPFAVTVKPRPFSLE
ncbi:MAG: hypothetical protein AB2598_19905, partial [Candidatus Thiodiazotropha sp.]